MRQYSCYSYNTELDRSGFPCGKYYYYYSMQWIFLIVYSESFGFPIPYSICICSMCKECNDKRIMSPKMKEEDGDASWKIPYIDLQKCKMQSE